MMNGDDAVWIRVSAGQSGEGVRAIRLGEFPEDLQSRTKRWEMGYYKTMNSRGKLGSRYRRKELRPARWGPVEGRRGASIIIAAFVPGLERVCFLIKNPVQLPFLCRFDVQHITSEFDVYFLRLSLSFLTWFISSYMYISILSMDTCRNSPDLQIEYATTMNSAYDSVQCPGSMDLVNPGQVTYRSLCTTMSGYTADQGI
jgi:hypothetical protein